jgi:CHASE1-domain containing sensor protein
VTLIETIPAMHPTVTDWISAVANSVIALTAIVAAVAWRKTLVNQRTDECIMAVLATRAAINRVLGLIRAGRTSRQIWDADGEAWRTWRRFEQTYRVMRKYDTCRRIRQPK